MNKKLIAAAVSAAVVAPVASQADVTVYGRINNAIDINDISTESDDDDSRTNITGISSRLGFRASSDLGNGLTAHGVYEFATYTDREGGNDDGDRLGGGIDDTRIATVGLSGAFGRIDVGNQWSSYFNTVGTLISPTYSLGALLYSGVGGGPFRASNTIKYSNTFGPLHAQLDIRLNEDGDGTGGETADDAEALRGEGFGLGLSFAVNDNITIAAAYDREQREDEIDDPQHRSLEITRDETAGDGILYSYEEVADQVGHDETRLGIAVNANFGGFWGTVGWQRLELDDVEPISGTGPTDFNPTAAMHDNGGAADDTDNTVTLTIANPEEINSFFLYGGGSLGEKTSWLLGWSQADWDADFSGADDPSQFTWGVYHNLGGGMRIYYEGTDFQNDLNINLADGNNLTFSGVQDTDEGNRHLLGMRFDF